MSSDPAQSKGLFQFTKTNAPSMKLDPARAKSFLKALTAELATLRGDQPKTIVVGTAMAEMIAGGPVQGRSLRIPVLRARQGIGDPPGAGPIQPSFDSIEMTVDPRIEAGKGYILQKPTAQSLFPNVRPIVVEDPQAAARTQALSYMRAYQQHLLGLPRANGKTVALGTVSDILKQVYLPALKAQYDAQANGVFHQAVLAQMKAQQAAHKNAMWASVYGGASPFKPGFSPVHVWGATHVDKGDPMAAVAAGLLHTSADDHRFAFAGHDLEVHSERDHLRDAVTIRAYCSDCRRTWTHAVTMHLLYAAQTRPGVVLDDLKRMIERENCGGNGGTDAFLTEWLTELLASMKGTPMPMQALMSLTPAGWQGVDVYEAAKALGFVNIYGDAQLPIKHPLRGDA